MSVRILVVDDSEIERHLVKGLLIRNSDFHVELASDGREALSHLQQHAVDVVITDLIMPEMDGLELVRALRQDHPQVPAILLTAYGDESIAMTALEAGAASYVPKAQQAERLRKTVQRVVDHAAADHLSKRLSKSMLDFHCRYCLENDTRLIRALVKLTHQVMADQCFADTVERIRTCEAFEESLLNAMFHGNLELSDREYRQAKESEQLEDVVKRRLRDPQIAERRVSAVVHLRSTEARFVIRDEGRGFRIWSVDESERFALGARRGLTLIESLMDEVRFNDSGNEVTLRKTVTAAVSA